MTAANVLGQMAGMLASGGIEVVDCSGVLGPEKDAGMWRVDTGHYCLENFDLGALL